MEIAAEEILKISPKKMDKISQDPVKTAEAINLVYVSDTEDGIFRLKRKNQFDYIVKNKKLKDASHINRIRNLVIPPAWENVWICLQPNGHLQATGFDVKNRKQYRYHSLWNLLRNQTKFYRLYEFGNVLPTIRLQLEKDLSLPDFPKEKVMAAIVSLMERTHIRVGNSTYEKLYGSYGLTTLKDKHVSIKGDNLKFSFVGKKGVQHNITIRNKKLSKIVQNCRDIRGQALFQYIDKDGNRHNIDSGMVNEYIRTISGSDYTAKDFRTWAGTVEALMAFKELGFVETKSEVKKKINEAVDIVAKQLGNTKTVCKKYYVHPMLVTMYEDKSLAKYIKQLDKIEKEHNKSGLTAEEQVLMKILKLH